MNGVAVDSGLAVHRENIIQNGDVNQGTTRGSGGDFAEGESHFEAFRHHVRWHLVEHGGNSFTSH